MSLRHNPALRILSAIVFLLSLLVSSLFIPVPTAHAAVSGKNLVLVGGALAEDNAAIYGKIIELAGGSGAAKIGIITCASIPESQDPDAGTPDARNSRANAEYYAGLFKGYGAIDAQWIPIDLDHISNNSSPEVIKQVNSMTGFFFGGGDQSFLIPCLYNGDRTDSPVLSAIRAKHARGAVISGTSAGTAVQSVGPMFTSGESYEGLRDGSFPVLDNDLPNRLSYDPKGGLKFFSYGLIDSHFNDWGRPGRAMRLAKDTKTPIAYGVDQNTALVVTNADTPNVSMQVIGEGGVTIIDVSKAFVGPGRSWSLFGAKVSYLTQDDTYNPLTKQAHIASWKTSLAGHEANKHAMKPATDIFSSILAEPANPRQFANLAINLFDSRAITNYGLTYEKDPTFRVQLTKLWSAGYKGTLNDVAYYSYTNLRVDIFKV